MGDIGDRRRHYDVLPLPAVDTRELGDAPIDDVPTEDARPDTDPRRRDLRAHDRPQTHNHTALR